jgi:hypothetical protein
LGRQLKKLSVNLWDVLFGEIDSHLLDHLFPDLGTGAGLGLLDLLRLLGVADAVKPFRGGFIFDCFLHLTSSKYKSFVHLFVRRDCLQIRIHVSWWAEGAFTIIAQ